MISFLKGYSINASTKSTLNTAYENLLKKDISELEKFTKEELPGLIQSNTDALSALEQTAKNLKALIKID